MTEKREEDLQAISEVDAAWLIERAALLDAAQGEQTNVARLREAAHEAGISADAFDRALEEVRMGRVTTPKRAGKVSEITRRIFTDFLPGWLTALILPPLLFKPSTFLEIGPRQIGLLTIAAAAAVTGHALASLLIRSRHGDDARITDRVSFVVGALVPVGFVALQITRVLRSPVSNDVGALVWAGIAAALTLIGFGSVRLFALLRSTRKMKSDSTIDSAGDREGPWSRFVRLAAAYEPQSLRVPTPPTSARY